MSIRAIAGLLSFDLSLGLAGWALLFGVRGLRSWSDIVRLAGLAFLLGFAAVAAVLTALLAFGIPFGAWTVAGACASVAAVGLALGLRSGRARPLSRRSGFGCPIIDPLGPVRGRPRPLLRGAVPRDATRRTIQLGVLALLGAQIQGDLALRRLRSRARRRGTPLPWVPPGALRRSKRLRSRRWDRWTS